MASCPGSAVQHSLYSVINHRSLPLIVLDPHEEVMVNWALTLSDMCGSRAPAGTKVAAISLSLSFLKINIPKCQGSWEILRRKVAPKAPLMSPSLDLTLSPPSFSFTSFAPTEKCQARHSVPKQGEATSLSTMKSLWTCSQAVAVSVNAARDDQTGDKPAMLLPMFNSHMRPLCIVGVGVAEHSHLLQDISNVPLRERKSGKQKEKTERQRLEKLCKQDFVVTSGCEVRADEQLSAAEQLHTLCRMRGHLSTA
ncbi:hypothetical protein Q8A73_004137 [Channa argus]|nr:hypothetical protein Q8A73_004137 [Channa argus]